MKLVRRTSGVPAATRRWRSPHASSSMTRAPHQRVGGERVGAGGVALEQQHARAGAGEEQRRGGAGRTGPGDHGVVARGEGHGRTFSGGDADAQEAAISAASASASRPTPSMKFELRWRRKRSPST